MVGHRERRVKSHRRKQGASNATSPACPAKGLLRRLGASACLWQFAAFAPGAGPQGVGLVVADEFRFVRVPTQTAAQFARDFRQVTESGRPVGDLDVSVRGWTSLTCFRSCSHQTANLSRKFSLKTGIHLNAKGYAIWKNAVRPCLK
jgi:hypothetical protein